MVSPPRCGVMEAISTASSVSTRRSCSRLAGGCPAGEGDACEAQETDRVRRVGEPGDESGFNEVEVGLGAGRSLLAGRGIVGRLPLDRAAHGIVAGAVAVIVIMILVIVVMIMAVEMVMMAAMHERSQ